ncbi:hypothetical protein ACC689_36200, partial [Rhizobium ruizarguesonis]
TSLISTSAMRSLTSTPPIGRAWAALADHDLVGEADSIGLMGGLQLAAEKSTRTRYAKPDKVGALVRNHALANGLVLR